LGFSAGLDFESKILVKEDAPRLLRDELLSPRWKPQLLAISGVTDAYQPVERETQITRRCLQVLAEFRNPVAIVTKNHLVTRDIDILAEMAKFKAAAVFISVTTLDENLSRVMEPRASVPRLRLQTIRELAQAGIPVGVLVAPVVPALTDHEMPSIVDAVTREGAQFAGYVFLRLPYAVSPLFEDWLSRNFPDRKAKVLNRIREIREGRLNDPRFGSRKRGSGIFAEQVEALFRTACQKAGILGRSPDLSTASFRRPQLELF
jgi:DNA repair photolyase